MPFDGIVTPRSWGPRVPGGVHGSPWLQPAPLRVRKARTFVLAYGPQLLREADEPPTAVMGGSAPSPPSPRGRGSA